ncbi:MAG: hydroxyisourate hydrolase [Flavobacteriales bacterium]
MLDTARGMPARGVRVTLQRSTAEHRWEDLAMGSTNADGRIGLRAQGYDVDRRHLRMRFDVSAYFSEHKTGASIPTSKWSSNLDDDGHYHVPLLLSPWGFSTYRGVESRSDICIVMGTLVDILSVLRRERTRLFAKYGLKSMAVFGSATRDDFRPDSDVDIMIEMGTPLGIEFIDLADELEGLLEQVDLATKVP